MATSLITRDYPTLGTVLTPKTDELVVDSFPNRWGCQQGQQSFLEGFEAAFGEHAGLDGLQGRR